MAGSKTHNDGEPSALRKRAEKEIAQSPKNTDGLLPGQTLRVLHELRVHQVELEMQNEELKESRSELEAERMRYFELYNLAPLGYCTISEQGRISEANFATVTLLGEPKDALLNQPISRFIFREDQDIYYLHCKKLFETCQPQTFELQMVKKDGTVFWARMNISVTEVDETAIAHHIVLSDITERKRAEEELLRQKNLLVSIIESSSEAIFAKDMAGKYVSINESGARMLGYRTADVIGRTDAELLSAETALEFRETDESVMSDGQVREREETGEINGNTCIFLSHKAPWLSNSGEIIGIVGISDDITERKRLNEEKAKIEGQLQKIASLIRMSASVAHHFNNKLHVVMGYLEMVIGNMPQSDSRTIKLERALQSAKKASEISGNLLAYVGRAQGKIELLDLAELCRISVPVLQTGKSKNVTLKPDLPSPGPLISANAKQIQQILTNLAINAWEAIGDKAGTVHLTVRKVPSTDIPASHRFPTGWQPREQNYACLEVTDSGCGVQEKDMDKIFDPFFTTKFTGRGLGLSVVLGIVKTYGAGITIESRIARGSVFRVFFPMSEQTADSHDKQVIKAPDIGTGGTVLLVEDEDTVLEMTAITLESLGFTVLQAKDGIEAVEIFQQHKDEISCLLCDLAMPRMDGWETISALRAIRHDLPVILASGYDEVSVMTGKHPEMPDVFLNKPYETGKLGDIIRQAMAGKSDQRSVIDN